MNAAPETLMRAAIEQARLAEQEGDVPIGAVVAREGRIIAAAHNRRIIDAELTRGSD